MALIQGKDWAFEVSEEDLVRMAISRLRRVGEKITMQAVCQLSGLSVARVESVMRQIVAKGQNNGQNDR